MLMRKIFSDSQGRGALNCMNIFLVNPNETSYMRNPPVHLQEPHDLRLVVEGEQLGGDGGRGGRGGTAHGDAHHGDLLRVLNEVWCKFQYY